MTSQFHSRSPVGLGTSPLEDSGMQFSTFKYARKFATICGDSVTKLSGDLR